MAHRIFLLHLMLLYIAIAPCLSKMDKPPVSRGVPRGYPGHCPKDCCGHGACLGFDNVYYPPVCKCDMKWEGKDCCQKQCPKKWVDGYSCSGHGDCLSSGICECKRGWAEEDCSRKLGKCDGPLGNCSTPDCTTRMYRNASDIMPPPRRKCPKDCSGHGKCDPKKGVCLCALGWQGKACDLAPCPGTNEVHECSGHGNCNFPQASSQSWYGGTCVCDDGWYGSKCTKFPPPCIHNCSEHGNCVRSDKKNPISPGVCECHPPFQGEDCSFANGCVPGYHGGEPGCKNDCSCQGVCSGGRCLCEPGYAGPDCSAEIPYSPE